MAEIVEQPRLYGMMFRLQVLAAVGCGLTLLYAFHDGRHAFLKIAATGIGIGGGASLLGLLFGFIFCYPRVRKGQDAAAASSNAIEDNSSLADISDWLTKIIVGVGLVELNKIPPALNRLAINLSAGLQSSGTASAGSGQIFALSLLLFYFPLGFMFGFIWTRFFYQEALQSLMRQIRNLQQDNTVLLQDKTALQQKTTATDLADTADAMIAEGNLPLAASQVDQALAQDPENAKALFVKARVLKRQACSPNTNSYDTNTLRQALGFMSKAAEKLPGRSSPLYNKACYQALLGVPGHEVVSTLRQALQITPVLARTAATDTDLSAVREQSKEFRDLLREYGVPAAGYSPATETKDVAPATRIDAPTNARVDASTQPTPRASNESSVGSGADDHDDHADDGNANNSRSSESL